MGTERFYKPGSHYKICDRTGFAMRAEDARTEWTGAVVRKDVFEARHPQDFVRGRADNQTVPNARPRPDDVFVDSNDVQASEYPQSDGS